MSLPSSLSHHDGLSSVAMALGSADCCDGGSCSHGSSVVIMMGAHGKAAGPLMAFLLLWLTWEEFGLVIGWNKGGWSPPP